MEVCKVSDERTLMKLMALPSNGFKWVEHSLSGKGLGKIPLLVAIDKLIGMFLRPKGEFMIEAQGNTLYTIADEIGVSLLENGYWEKCETDYLKSTLREGMTLVDVGAHIGYFSLIGAGLVGKNGTVYAFEPQPDNYRNLSRNINMNKLSGKVIAELKAVTNCSGKTKFCVCKDDSINSSLVSSNVFTRKRFIDIETVSLDEYFGNKTDVMIDVLKIDVGGSEGQIIDGSSRLLTEKRIRTIFLEYWPFGLINAGYDPDSLLAKLHECGFKIKFAREISDQSNTPLTLDGEMGIPEFNKMVGEKSIYNLIFTL
jgi:FkbM family methyltransferase